MEFKKNFRFKKRKKRNYEIEKKNYGVEKKKKSKKYFGIEKKYQNRVIYFTFTFSYCEVMFCTKWGSQMENEYNFCYICRHKTKSELTD